MIAACPTDDVLGAHMERALAAHETALVTAHLDGCAACRWVVIAAVRGGVASNPTLAIGTPTHDRAMDETAPRSPSASPVVGSCVGRYEICGVLGEGGMGHVYAAYDAELDRSIALKVMRPELVGVTGKLAERLVRESRAMAKLAHPSVITVYDVGRTGDAVFLAMELIRGETLGSYARRVRPGWRELVALLERAGQGLAAAHDAGIIHRDFKPENVLVELDPERIKPRVSRVVVTDFGVARIANPTLELDQRSEATGGVPRGIDKRSEATRRGAPTGDTVRGGAPRGIDDGSSISTLDADPKLTAAGTTVGTPAYMAPEQLDGRAVDRRADVFAFAVSAWELVFGERPFRGKTVDQIRCAMRQPPVPPHDHDVPGRVVEALVRGLAIEPAARHADMHAFVRALAATRRRRRGVAATASGLAAIGLIGVGIAGTRMFGSTASDPCARGSATFDEAYDDVRAASLRIALADDPKAADVVIARLDRAATRWHDAHRATCNPDSEPPQAAATTACLDARRLELEATVDDLVLDGPVRAAYATRLIDVVGDPSACTTPAPGLIEARVPADRASRRTVTALRYRAFDSEAERDRGDYKRALATAGAVVAAAKSGWPGFYVETLYLMGTIQTQGGDSAKSIATFREAAALAERVHHDYIAANSWIQLVQATTFDDADPERGLEYAAYAESAVDRIGRPPDVVVLLDYSRGTALVQLQRYAEAEVALRRAFALAEVASRDSVPLVIQGLGYLLEDRQRFPEAVAMYRRAIAEFATQRSASPAIEMTIRDRLAASLGMIGELAEAEASSRKSVELADRTLDDMNVDRALKHANLAQILQLAGKLDAALAEATEALGRIANIHGDRHPRYATMLVVVGTILNQLERYAEAEPKLARACEILAFEFGDTSAQVAECLIPHAVSLSSLDRDAAALALADKAVPILVGSGDAGVDLANAYLMRGAIHGDLGHRAKAIGDLERAVAAFARSPGTDPGQLAAAEALLGQQLWQSDRARAHALVERSIQRFATGTAMWGARKREVAAWLAARS